MSQIGTIRQRLNNVWYDYERSIREKMEYLDKQSPCKSQDAQEQPKRSDLVTISVGNFQRLKKSEEHFWFFAWCVSTHSELRKHLEFVLRDCLGRTANFTLLGLLNQLAKTENPGLRLAICRPYFEQDIICRALRLLNDPNQIRMFQKRFRVSFKRPKRELPKTDRIRGYRDHGSLGNPTRKDPQVTPRSHVEALKDLARTRFLESPMRPIDAHRFKDDLSVLEQVARSLPEEYHKEPEIQRGSLHVLGDEDRKKPGEVKIIKKTELEKILPISVFSDRKR